MPRPLKPIDGRRFTKDCLIRGREAEGRKLIMKMGARNVRVVEKGMGDRPSAGAESFTVPLADVMDIRPTSPSDAEVAPPFEKIGERGVITIPVQYRESHGLRPGTAVLIEEREDGLLLRPARVVPLSLDETTSHPSLTELLARITPENLHEEVDFGPAVGAESL